MQFGDDSALCARAKYISNRHFLAKIDERPIGRRQGIEPLRVSAWVPTNPSLSKLSVIKPARGMENPASPRGNYPLPRVMIRKSWDILADLI